MWTVHSSNASQKYDLGFLNRIEATVYEESIVYSAVPN
jgi:hypothetical protein